MEKQDMQRIIEMLAKAEANKERAEVDRKADKEEIKTGHKELLAKVEADRKADKEERKAAQVKADADRV
jgi:hypothetical protein